MGIREDSFVNNLHEIYDLIVMKWWLTRVVQYRAEQSLHGIRRRKEVRVPQLLRDNMQSEHELKSNRTVELKCQGQFQGTP